MFIYKNFMYKTIIFSGLQLGKNPKKLLPFSSAFLIISIFAEEKDKDTTLIYPNIFATFVKAFETLEIRTLAKIKTVLVGDLVVLNWKCASIYMNYFIKSAQLIT